MGSCQCPQELLTRMKLIKQATLWSTLPKMDAGCNDFIWATITQGLWGRTPVTIYQENSLHGAVPLTAKLLVEDKEGQVTTGTSVALTDNEFLTVHGEEMQMELIKIKYMRNEWWKLKMAHLNTILVPIFHYGRSCNIKTTTCSTSGFHSYNIHSYYIEHTVLHLRSNQLSKASMYSRKYVISDAARQHWRYIRWNLLN